MRGPHAVRFNGNNTYDNYVPTFGYPGFTNDLVATDELVISGFEGIHGCFSDTYAFQALTRLIEGPIRSIADLQAAEAALQALVFYDHVSLLSPGIVSREGDKGGLIRARPTLPEPYSCEELRGTISDEIVIFEHVDTSGGNILTSTLQKPSSLLGHDLPLSTDEYYRCNPLIPAVMSMYPSKFRMAAFFADPLIQSYHQDRGFSGKLYEAVNMSVLEASEIVPGSTIEVRLPLLVWCLTSRVNSRADIIGEIAALREEFSEARYELSQLDQRANDVTSEAQRVDLAQHYTEAFEVAVDAARQSNVSHTRHIIYQIIDFAIKTPITAGLALINPNWKQTNPRSIVKRSIAARAFAELLQLEVAKHIVETLLSPEEVAILEYEARNKI